MAQLPPVGFVCVEDVHLRLGLSVPDEHGHLTIRNGQWAYCSAARPDEPHIWGKITPTPLFALRHSTLRQKFAVGAGPRAGTESGPNP